MTTAGSRRSVDVAQARIFTGWERRPPASWTGPVWVVIDGDPVLVAPHVTIEDNEVPAIVAGVRHTFVRSTVWMMLAIWR